MTGFDKVSSKVFCSICSIRLIPRFQKSFPDKPVALAFGSSQTKKPEQGLHRAIGLFIEQQLLCNVDGECGIDINFIAWSKCGSFSCRCRVVIQYRLRSVPLVAGPALTAARYFNPTSRLFLSRSVRLMVRRPMALPPTSVGNQVFIALFFNFFGLIFWLVSNSTTKTLTLRMNCMFVVCIVSSRFS
jgi:hypothetical protein